MDMVDFRDVVDLFCSYDSGIQMSNASCNQHHKGPASPLDDMLKTRFKQAGKSNSKKDCIIRDRIIIVVLWQNR